jgi:hypothetical protein
MDRVEATRRLEKVLRILADATDEPLRRVSAFYVFGSYARGAASVTDIDVDIEYEVDEARALLETQRRMSGRSGQSDLRRALFGAQRAFHAHFREYETLERQLGGFALLWRRGESYELAMGRLRALRADPAAGRAPRDAIAPPLEGLAELLGRGVGLQLSEAIEGGLLDVEQVELADARPRDRKTLDSIERRWGPMNPLRRAALTAAAYLEQIGFRDISAGRGPAALSADEGRVLVDFGTRNLGDASQYLDGQADLWLQVVNPSRRRPLRGLLLRKPAQAQDGS